MAMSETLKELNQRRAHLDQQWAAVEDHLGGRDLTSVVSLIKRISDDKISFAELDRLLVEPDKRSVRVFAHLAICEALLRHHFALENHSHPTGEE